MRIRTLKPEFWSSESLASIPFADRFAAKLTFEGLWGLADDHGRGRCNVRLIRTAVFPLDTEVSDDDVARWLDHLEAVDSIRRYESEGRSFFYVPNWEKGQAAAYRRGDPVHPAPPRMRKRASRTPVHTDARSPVLEGKGREGNKEGKGTGIAQKEPARADVQESASAITPRARDAEFDALAVAEGSNPYELSRTTGTRIGTAIAQIREVTPGVTPEEIARRAANYPTHFDAAISAHAIAKWWARLDKPGTRSNGRPPRDRAAQIMADAVATREREEAVHGTR